MIDEPTQNKMMTGAPAKKEYHFAATTPHYAEVVWAATVQEAEALYHKVKRPIAQATTPADSTAGVATSDLPSTTAAPLSTPAPAPQEEGVE
jgi:hypothetical protein